MKIELPYEHGLSPLTKIKKYAKAKGDVYLQSVLKELESGNVYNKTKPWQPHEDDVIRLLYNQMELDELCEALMCSHLQLEERAKVLKVLPLDHGKITAEDAEMLMKFLKEGVPVERLFDFFGLEPPSETLSFYPEDRRALIDAVNKIENQLDLFDGGE